MPRGSKVQEIFKSVSWMCLELFTCLLISAVLRCQLGELGPTVSLNMLHRHLVEFQAWSLE